MATGYATLYGDKCGAFNPIKDLYKTEVYEIAKWKGGVPENILKKAPTAELRENQTDQDSLPPYDKLDAILKLLIEGRKSAKEIIKKGFKAEMVEKTAKLLYQSEYKRFQSAPGVKLSTTAFGNAMDRTTSSQVLHTRCKVSIVQLGHVKAQVNASDDVRRGQVSRRRGLPISRDASGS